MTGFRLISGCDGATFGQTWAARVADCSAQPPTEVQLDCTGEAECAELLSYFE